MARSLSFLPLDSKEGLCWAASSSASVRLLILVLGRKVSRSQAGCSGSPFLFSVSIARDDVDRSTDVPFGFMVRDFSSSGGRLVVVSDGILAVSGRLVAEAESLTIGLLIRS